MGLPQIVIIHDDWTDTSPVVVELSEKHGAENVKFIKRSQEGIDYILTAPARKTIVILDYNFKTGEPSGGDVFKKIREKSALIYVIIVTKSQWKDIDPNDFVEFVNNHALAIAGTGGDYTEIIGLVDTAIHQLEVRADVILEEWINSQTEEERSKPFLTVYEEGKVYSLNDILQNIREQTPLGKSITGNVLSYAIELAMKKFGQIND